MDFGAVDLEGLVGPENGVSSQVVSDHKATNSKSDGGSGLLKQGGSGSDENNWRGSKVARTDDSENPKTMLNLQGTNTRLLRSNSLLAAADSGQHQNMLSFSSPRSDVPFLYRSLGLAERSSQQSPPFPYYHHTTYPYTRNAGHGSGGLNGIGARGPFTPSQWIELEHQALIYKYIVANVPVPSNLLIALKRSLSPHGLCGLSSGSYAPNSLGWGSFHLGFSGGTDPEPGRCRRTDGKKWRCSRDAVADQKYCERHINRGRHRSRKPVEGRSGQPVSGSTTTKVVPIASSTSATVMSSSGATNSLSMTQHQFKGLQPGVENPSADVLVKRMQDSEGLSVISPTTNPKSKDCQFSIPKQHISIEESSHSEFGLVSCDSLLNPSQKKSYMNSRNCNSVLDFNDHKSHDQHPLHHFIDDWPKDQSSRTTIAWPEELKSDWTQLSMSIPMSTSDFSSTSSSSPQEKISPSPIRPSCELDPTQMCLAVNQNLSELTQKQTNWVPVSWESSMGGPLGEVLNSTTSTMGSSDNSSGLNILTGV